MRRKKSYEKYFFSRFCIKCQKKFLPTGKYQHNCEECLLKIYKNNGKKSKETREKKILNQKIPDIRISNFN